MHRTWDNSSQLRCARDKFHSQLDPVPLDSPTALHLDSRDRGPHCPQNCIMKPATAVALGIFVTVFLRRQRWARLQPIQREWSPHNWTSNHKVSAKFTLDRASARPPMRDGRQAISPAVPRRGPAANPIRCHRRSTAWGQACLDRVTPPRQQAALHLPTSKSSSSLLVAFYDHAGSTREWYSSNPPPLQGSGERPSHPVANEGSRPPYSVWNHKHEHH